MVLILLPLDFNVARPLRVFIFQADKSNQIWLDKVNLYTPTMHCQNCQLQWHK
jgi:hypothetical protein